MKSTRRTYNLMLGISENSKLTIVSAINVVNNTKPLTLNDTFHAAVNWQQINSWIVQICS